MAKQLTSLQYDELYYATQALSLGNLNAALNEIDQLPEEIQQSADAILARLHIYEAQGSFLELEKLTTRVLSPATKLCHGLPELLRLVGARCEMMICLRMGTYVAQALEIWDSVLKGSDLETCNESTLYLEVEFHRGIHTYVHFTYNFNEPSERPREPGFSMETHPFYPLPFTPKEGAARLQTIINRLLETSTTEAAYRVFKILTAWYSPSDIDSRPLMRKIAEHPMSGPLLVAKIYALHAAILAHPQNFKLTSVLVEEAKSIFRWLDATGGSGELRMVEAKLGFIALGQLRGLSSRIAAEVLEGEYVSMIGDFIATGHYRIAATAVTQYMNCVDYLSQPKMVTDILELADQLAAKSGNYANLWTIRLIALASTPLKSHIALGVQNLWCEEFMQNHADSGAWELLRRFALNSSMYFHRIGDRTQQVKWTRLAGVYEGRMTNDAESLLSNQYHTFTVLLLRIQDLEGEELHDAIMEAREFGMEGLGLAREAGLMELVQKFATKLSVLFMEDELREEEEVVDLPIGELSLGEARDIDSSELLDLYIKHRDMLDHFLERENVEQVLQIQQKLTDHFNEIYSALSLGLALKLRAADFGIMQAALDVRVSQRLLAIRTLTHEQKTKALSIAQSAATRSAQMGEFHNEREALYTAAQWTFQLKPANWGREVLDCLYRAEDCMDMTRTKITATSRIDSLEGKQVMVASFGRTDVYAFGYAVLSALCDTTDTLALMDGGDKVDEREVWEWIQRGKGRSIVDLLYAVGRDGSTEDASKNEESTIVELPAGHKSLAVDLGSRLALEDMLEMAAFLREQEPASSMVLVDWFVGDSHIDMIVVTASGEIHTKILDFTLEAAIRSIMRQPLHLRSAQDVVDWKEAYLGQSEFQSDVFTLEALGELDWLVEPLGEYSNPGDLLVFCPSGVLHGVPLHALSVGGECLVERNPVVYTGSLSLTASCYKTALKRSGASGAAVFGVYGKAGKTEDRKSKEDVEVEATLERISSQLGTTVSYNITPDEFTTGCRGQNIIHYHGHAVLGQEQQRQSRFNHSLVLRESSGGSDATASNLLSWNDSIDDSLLLGPEDSILGGSQSSKLTARNMISSLDLSSAHVTLIACNSATQNFSSGDEPQGLIPILLLCGATSVLGTLWPILSSDGRMASETFYSEFGQGAVVNLAKAAQRSALAIRAERPEPVHWAGFVLHGAWFHRC